MIREHNEFGNEKYQVNFSEKVDGNSYAWVSRYSPDGYRGRLTDTVYSDGADFTNWCIFWGTKEECEKYASEINNGERTDF